MAVETRRPPFPFPRPRDSVAAATDEQRARTKDAAAPAAPFDHVLAATVLCLVGFGLVMIYSASHVLAERTYHAGTYFLSRQVVFALLGTAVMIGVSYIPYRWYRAAAA